MTSLLLEFSVSTMTSTKTARSKTKTTLILASKLAATRGEPATALIILGAASLRPSQSLGGVKNVERCFRMSAKCVILVWCLLRYLSASVFQSETAVHYIRTLELFISGVEYISNSPITVSNSSSVKLLPSNKYVRNFPLLKRQYLHSLQLLTRLCMHEFA